MEDIINRLIDLVINTAPKVWAIAMRQVYTNVILDAMWAVALAVVIYLGTRLTKVGARMKHEDNCSDWEWRAGVGWALIIIPAFVIMILINDMASYLLNPEFTAIKILLNVGE